MSNDSVMIEEIIKKDVEGLMDQFFNCSLEFNEILRKLGNVSVYGKGEVNFVMIECFVECFLVFIWLLINSLFFKVLNLWCIVDKEVLVVLVVQKILEKFENCDFFILRFKCRIIMDSWEVFEENFLDVLKFVDCDLFIFLFQDGDLFYFENVGLYINICLFIRLEFKFLLFFLVIIQFFNIFVGCSMFMYYCFLYSYRYVVFYLVVLICCELCVIRFLIFFLLVVFFI